MKLKSAKTCGVENCNFFPKLDLQVQKFLNLQGDVVETWFFPADLTTLFSVYLCELDLQLQKLT